MRFLIAILLPWLSLMMQGKVMAGLICLILQCTFIGWIPAAIWSVSALNKQYADERNDKLISAVNKAKGAF